MMIVTHHGSTACHDSRANADRVRALSAMGSTMRPKSVMSPRLRAKWPSNLSVMAAMAKTTKASSRSRYDGLRAR